MLPGVLSLRLCERRPVGNLRCSADGARSLLEKISTPYAILAGHLYGVSLLRFKLYPNQHSRHPKFFNRVTSRAL